MFFDGLPTRIKSISIRGSIPLRPSEYTESLALFVVDRLVTSEIREPMGIRFLCEHCSKRLNIKSFLAGKKGICPHCGGRIRIPFKNELPDAEAGAPLETAVASGHVASANADEGVAARRSLAGSPTEEASQEKPWYVNPPGSGQFGPADRTLVEQWIEEGRVTADTLVWQEGWSDWQRADHYFVQLQLTRPGDLDGSILIDTSEPAGVSDLVEAIAEPVISDPFLDLPAANPANQSVPSYPRSEAPVSSFRPKPKQLVIIGAFAFFAMLLVATFLVVLYVL